MLRFQVCRQGSGDAYGMQELGLKLLHDQLHLAAMSLMCLQTSKTMAKDIRAAVAFVTGTELNIIMHAFAFDAHPDRFREEFLDWCLANQRPNWPSSYLTTQATSSLAV